VDDLSFEGIKLLVDFIFLFFDSFLEVVEVAFFVLQELGKFWREEFNLLK
jgi:hypothetical protein